MTASTIEIRAARVDQLPSRSTALSRIVVVAHAPLASAFVKAATDIAGICLPVLAVDHDTVTSREATLAVALASSSTWPLEAGVLVLTDLPGYSSPGVVAQQLVARLGRRARLLGGMNMPMLLTALMHSGDDLDAAWRSCRQSATLIEAQTNDEYRAPEPQEV